MIDGAETYPTNVSSNIIDSVYDYDKSVIVTSFWHRSTNRTEPTQFSFDLLQMDK